MPRLPQLPSSPFSLVAFAFLFGLFLTGCDEAVLGPTLRGTIEGRVLMFDDIEYRVCNTGRTDVNAYEVYVRIETTGSAFFQEIRGDALPAAQADVASFSTFIRSETAQAVTIEDVWVGTAGA